MRSLVASPKWAARVRLPLPNRSQCRIARGPSNGSDSPGTDARRRALRAGSRWENSFESAALSYWMTQTLLGQLRPLPFGQSVLNWHGTVHLLAVVSQMPSLSWAIPQSVSAVQFCVENWRMAGQVELRSRHRLAAAPSTVVTPVGDANGNTWAHDWLVLGGKQYGPVGVEPKS